jgi:hypothetical protein
MDIDLDKIEDKQWDVGMEIEKEHTPTYNMLEEYVRSYGKMPSKKVFFKSIVKDHFMEGIVDYYVPRLLKLEKDAFKELGIK